MDLLTFTRNAQMYLVSKKHTKFTSVGAFLSGAEFASWIEIVWLSNDSITESEQPDNSSCETTSVHH